AGIAHHIGTPFQSGWDRMRTQGWRSTRTTATSTNSTRTKSHNPLPIAGQRRPVGRPPAAAPGTAAGAAARGGAGGAPAGGAVGVAAAAATAGVRTAARRVTGGGGPAAPAGFQTVRVAGGGHLFVPNGGVRNPRPAGGANG